MLGELGCPGQEEEDGEANQQLLLCTPAECGHGSLAAPDWMHPSVPPPRLDARFALWYDGIL